MSDSMWILYVCTVSRSFEHAKMVERAQKPLCALSQENVAPGPLVKSIVLVEGDSDLTGVCNGSCRPAEVGNV